MRNRDVPALGRWTRSGAAVAPACRCPAHVAGFPSSPPLRLRCHRRRHRGPRCHRRRAVPRRPCVDRAAHDAERPRAAARRARPPTTTALGRIDAGARVRAVRPRAGQGARPGEDRRRRAGAHAAPRRRADRRGSRGRGAARALGVGRGPGQRGRVRRAVPGAAGPARPPRHAPAPARHVDRVHGHRAVHRVLRGQPARGAGRA